ncbi:DUF6134 family protein [Pokkaliibacter sp. CJK22405]|uniref:DUF6134 family protein n=1 Tax=Pokkaliibacter sp. CJK22405 TaxID=3384615 RepID=UPI00398465B8
MNRAGRFSFLLMAVMGLSGWASAAPLQRDWQQFYGPQGLQFDVVRKGKTIGEYRGEFATAGDGFVFHSTMSIDLSILFMDFTYRYDARETWQPQAGDWQMQSLKVKVDDDGDAFALDLASKNDALSGTRQDKKKVTEVRFPNRLLTSQHYNPAILGQQQLINTLTGEINHFTLKNFGQEKISSRDGSIKATHYQYQGDLHDTDVWYDAAGHWVGMAFKASDGSQIRLVCRQCGQ